MSKEALWGCPNPAVRAGCTARCSLEQPAMTMIFYEVYDDHIWWSCGDNHKYMMIIYESYNDHMIDMMTLPVGEPSFQRQVFDSIVLESSKSPRRPPCNQNCYHNHDDKNRWSLIMINHHNCDLVQFAGYKMFIFSVISQSLVTVCSLRRSRYSFTWSRSWHYLKIWSISW